MVEIPIAAIKADESLGRIAFSVQHPWDQLTIVVSYQYGSNGGEGLRSTARLRHLVRVANQKSGFSSVLVLPYHWGIWSRQFWEFGNVCCPIRCTTAHSPAFRMK